ncbi:hypothetical protein D3C80_1706460 [compost metagenome]
MGLDFLFFETVRCGTLIRTLSGPGKALFGGDIEDQRQFRYDAINSNALQRLDEIRLQIAGRTLIDT